VGLKYVMVTHWENHWDQLGKNDTHYPKERIIGGMGAAKFVNGTPTIFIKLNKKTRKPEKAWEGIVYDIRDKGDKVYFKVEIHREISIPEEYAKYRPGWYVEGAEEAAQSTLYPPFFDTLTTTSDPAEFEKYVYYLFKLIGINQVFRFESQRGHPDGFFIFRNLAVVYDATLESDFEREKGTQIENYCNLLKSGRLQYGKRYIDVSKCTKQVWIITRGAPRLVHSHDDIPVKEVPVSELFKVYLDRLEKDMDENELEIRLITICAQAT